VATVVLGTPLFEVYEVPTGQRVELFRIVHTRDRRAAAFRDSFVSNFQAGKAPRRAEHRSAAIQMGLSMYEQPSQAEQTARLFPVIGRYIARMTLSSGSGFNLASTGQVGHWTAWGQPDQFVAAVADVYPWY
jgi:hypothetical protein